MNWKQHQGWVLLVARLATAFVFLWHAVPKAFDFAVGQQKFIDMGFPGFLGPIVGWLEVIASALLIVGFQARWASLLLAAIIAVALVAVQLPQGVIPEFERDLLLLVMLLLLTAFGSGPLGLTKDE